MCLIIIGVIFIKSLDALVEIKQQFGATAWSSHGNQLSYKRKNYVPIIPALGKRDQKKRNPVAEM